MMETRKRKRERMMSQKHLLIELIEQILRRLRVKDLLKFRSVCKAWKTLIDSHSFKLTHFKSAANSSLSTLLIWRWNLTSGALEKGRHFPHFLSPHDASYEASLAFPPLDDSAKKFLPPPFSSSSYTPESENYAQFGVVNGLICLGCKRFMLIWNPSTRKFRYINPPMDPNWFRVSQLVKQCKSPDPEAGRFLVNGPVCAFGFDPKTNDYKVLITMFTKHGKAAVMLYSMRSDSWNSFIVDFPYFVFVHSADGFLDGCFYWFVVICFKTDDGSRPRGIVKFDFNLEKFDFIQLSGTSGPENTVVVTTRGCLELLTVIKGDDESRHCEIWGMRDDGMWSRKLRVGLSPEVGSPLGIRKDDQMICGGVMNDKLVLFNPNTGSFKILEDEDSYRLRVLTFVESLFSIR